MTKKPRRSRAPAKATGPEGGPVAAPRRKTSPRKEPVFGRVESEHVSSFASWRAAMGFNGKQVAEAGARVGLAPQAAGHRNRGTTEMSELERLGLTAAFLGLPPWRPDLAEKLDDRAMTLVRLAREEIERCLGARR